MILLAKAVACHGLKGHLKCRYFGDDPRDLKTYGTLWTDGESSLKLREVRPLKQDFVIIAFQGIPDRTSAEKFIHQDFYIKQDQLKPLGKDTFYHHDLLHYEIRISPTQSLGLVTHIENFGAGDIIEFSGGRFPLNKETVYEVDPTGKILWVHGHMIVYD